MKKPSEGVLAESNSTGAIDPESPKNLSSSDAKKVADHPLVDKINTRDEWIDLMQAIIDHGEENISQVNPSVMKTFLMNALRDLNKPKS